MRSYTKTIFLVLFLSLVCRTQASEESDQLILEIHAELERISVLTGWGLIGYHSNGGGHSAPGTEC